MKGILAAKRAGRYIVDPRPDTQWITVSPFLGLDARSMLRDVLGFTTAEIEISFGEISSLASLDSSGRIEFHHRSFPESLADKARWKSHYLHSNVFNAMIVNRAMAQLSRSYHLLHRQHRTILKSDYAHEVCRQLLSDTNFHYRLDQALETEHEPSDVGAFRLRLSNLRVMFRNISSQPKVRTMEGGQRER